MRVSCQQAVLPGKKLQCFRHIVAQLLQLSSQKRIISSKSEAIFQDPQALFCPVCIGIQDPGNQGPVTLQIALRAAGATSHVTWCF
jgi:hypothetical protein